MNGRYHEGVTQLSRFRHERPEAGRQKTADGNGGGVKGISGGEGIGYGYAPGEAWTGRRNVNDVPWSGTLSTRIVPP